MGLWKFFKQFTSLKGGGQSQLPGLADVILREFPLFDQERVARVASILGLFARVALSDSHGSIVEKNTLTSKLKDWIKDFTDSDLEIVANLALKRAKEMGSLDHHEYARYLGNILTLEERYQMLLDLFSLAAADANVISEEESEIKQICSELKLEQHHYLAARASVLKHLKTLKI